MNVLAEAYFASYVTFSLWSFRSDIKNKENPWKIVREALYDIALIISALSYWFSAVKNAFGALALPLFAFGLVGFLLQIVSAIRQDIPDPELSKASNLTSLALGAIFATFVVSPILVWGFLAAILNQTAGT